MRSPRPLIPVTFTDSVQSQLNMYALAASAAGVCLLAFSQASEAKIIYTKTHQVIQNDDIYALDLNHDGVVDFVIQEHSQVSPGTSTFVSLGIKSAFGNAVEGSQKLAAALTPGAEIGPQQRFTTNSALYGNNMAAFLCAPPSSFKCTWEGGWANVTNRYLGLKFQIHGKTHYGWARVSTQTQGTQLIATMTGYAYETIPDMGIVAGQTAGEMEDAHPIPDANTTETRSDINPPGSLGRLALGAQGVSLRRQP